MSACQDLIDFDLPSDWTIIASIVRNAVRVGKDSHIPIPPIDLGSNIESSHIAVFATTTDGIKPTWRYAGEIRRVWNFPSGSGAGTGRIHTPPTPLFINKLQLVETSEVSYERFGLVYQPPPWFLDCGVRVWRYSGDRANFVKDTLFNIGNAIFNPDSPLANEPVLAAINVLGEQVEECCQYFEDELADIKTGLATDFNRVFQELAAIKARLNQLSGGGNNQTEAIITSYFTGLL
ncbi:MAG: hypothetical protein ACFCU5_20905 [Pleurocapsa sp.]